MSSANYILGLSGIYEFHCFPLSFYFLKCIPYLLDKSARTSFVPRASTASRSRVRASSSFWASSASETAMICTASSAACSSRRPPPPSPPGCRSASARWRAARPRRQSFVPLHGTPITGSVVFAAIAPARCAAMPANARITETSALPSRRGKFPCLIRTPVSG